MVTIQTLHLALGLAVALLPQVGSDSVDDVLRRVRAATLGEAAPPDGKVLACEGSAHYAGLDGRFQFAFAPDGRFRMEVEHELGFVVAFDGERLMGTDRQGVTRAPILAEADDARLVAALLGGQWLDPDADLSISLPDATEPAHLDVRWSGSPTLAHATLENARLASFVRPSEASGTRWTLDDWRQVDGRWFPHRLDELQDGAVANHYAVENARWIDDDPALFTLEPGSTMAHAFDADIAPELEVFRVRTGHQLVRARIGDDDSGWFIFDSGAGGLVITPSVADTHAMPVRGEVVAVGASGTSTARLRRGPPLGLGPLTLAEPVFVEIDLAFLEEPFGVPVAGIVGYDILAHAVVEHTPSADRIAVYDPETYGLQDATWHELLLDENIPTLRGRFLDQHEGLFHLDTGAGDFVTFHAPTVARLDLLEGRELRGSRSQGVGGSAKVWNADITSLEVAGHRFEDLPARFATAEVGAFASAYTDGNIGLSLIGDATLVFDYLHGRLAWVVGDD